MTIFLNGEAQELPEGATVAHLLEKLELAGQRLAVEVNEDVIPRSEHTVLKLGDGDRVEIVRAVGGG